MSADFIEGDAYLVVRKQRDPLLWKGSSARILRVRQALANRPAKVEKDEIVVKVRLRIPAAAFEPLQPEAVVTVPVDLVQRAVAEVEAVQAESGEAGR